MNVSLTSQLEAFIEQKVREGSYQTASEVVREALRLLAERDERRSIELQRLRDAVAVGLEQVSQGRTEPLDVKKIKTEGRKRLAQRRIRRVG